MKKTHREDLQHYHNEGQKAGSGSGSLLGRPRVRSVGVDKDYSRRTKECHDAWNKGYREGRKKK